MVPKEMVDDTVMNHFRTFGRVIGLAIRYKVTPGLRFSRAILWQLVHFSEKTYPPQQFIDEVLEEEDPAFFHQFSLENMLVGDLVYTFDDWIPGSGDTVITAETYTEFIREFKKYRLFDSRRAQVERMLLGLTDTIRSIVFEILTPNELGYIIMGDDTIDVESLLENISFSEGISEEMRIWFKEVVTELTQEELGKLLTFVSASAKTPVTGFSHPIAERRWLHVTTAMPMEDVAANQVLPVAHTCFTVLDLPSYTTKEALKSKLLYAIEHAVTLELE